MTASPSVLIPPTPSIFPTPDQRATPSARKKLEQAEREAQEAQQRVEAEKQVLIARQEKIENLKTRRNFLVQWAANISRIDLAAKRTVCEGIIDELYCSPRLGSEPQRQIELDSAIKCAEDIDMVAPRIPGIRAKIERQLAAVDVELSALESTGNQ
jgi:hypothetical protein